jgi:hypothetical protein
MSSLNNNTVLTGASIHCRSSPSRNPHICNNPLAKAIEDNIKTDKKTNYKYLCDNKNKTINTSKEPTSFTSQHNTSNNYKLSTIHTPMNLSSSSDIPVRRSDHPLDSQFHPTDISLIQQTYISSFLHLSLNIKSINFPLLTNHSFIFLLMILL